MSVELYAYEKNHAFDEAGNEGISPPVLVTAKNAIIDDTTAAVITSQPHWWHESFTQTNSKRVCH